MSSRRHAPIDAPRDTTARGADRLRAVLRSGQATGAPVTVSGDVTTRRYEFTTGALKTTFGHISDTVVFRADRVDADDGSFMWSVAVEVPSNTGFAFEAYKREGLEEYGSVGVGYELQSKSGTLARDRDVPLFLHLAERVVDGVFDCPHPPAARPSMSWFGEAAVGTSPDYAGAHVDALTHMNDLSAMLAEQLFLRELGFDTGHETDDSMRDWVQQVMESEESFEQTFTEYNGDLRTINRKSEMYTDYLREAQL